MSDGQNSISGEILLKSISCCFSGHRQIRPQDEDTIKARLSSQIASLISHGITRFYCGGALGFDTLAAICVLEQKRLNNNISLIMALPCKSQTKYFNKYEKQTYEHILSQADEVIYTSEKYLPGCMQLRNRYMVDNCSHCICYMRKETGGTYYTSRYARERGIDVIYI